MLTYFIIGLVLTLYIYTSPKWRALLKYAHPSIYLLIFLFYPVFITYALLAQIINYTHEH